MAETMAGDQAGSLHARIVDRVTGICRGYRLSALEPRLEACRARLASQWTDAVNTSIAAIERAAVKSVQEQIVTVESLLLKTRSEAEQIRKDLQDVGVQAGAMPS